ncbi:MAG: D-alanyl-D-alanine carboxypeptidase/D-alanyl-D-alanine-endopeptidase [Thermoleophilia bacterium]|nr:D-alanyl-D-alanine carboxypeptidase/D-alanyl-D-alanine-endopeptidase [Thermoleophilia bacterium]
MRRFWAGGRGPPAPRRGAAAAVAVALLAAAPAPASPVAGARGQALAGPDLPFRAAAPTGLADRRSMGRGALRRKLRRLARRAPGSSGYFVARIGGRSSKPIFDRNAGHSRKLASNEKLFTTATALHRLGPKWRIPTRVKIGGKVRRGRLRGDIYLIGGGDPSFGADGVHDLARQVRREGIHRISGRVIGDDSVFDRRRGVPDSNWGPSPYIAPLSGLVYGGSTYSGDPAKEAAKAFRNELRDAGVRVGGKVRVRRAPGSVRSREAIAEHESATIASLVRATNKDSINFYAEMLLKRLWAKGGRKGTTNGGVKAVERFAGSVGSKVRARDGSGLTASNKASPRDVARLLAAAQRDDELAKPLFRSLAIAGRDGTLRSRMNGSSAAGRCRGKTGTLTGVSNLSGYCKSKRGLVVFSLLMNGVSDLDAAHHIQDEMVVAISRLGS